MDLATYDVRLAHDIDARNDVASTNQLARDARRSAYDAVQAQMPITMALRALRVPANTTTPNAFPRRAPKPLHAIGATLGAKGKVVPNDWEARAPLDVHRAPDGSCHHPLVKCVHKW